MKKQGNSLSFINNRLNGMIPTIILVGGVVLIYMYLMWYVDHSLLWIQYAVVLFSTLKVCFFTFITFKQIKLAILKCHSLPHLMWIFGLLIFLMIFSFASDYVCLAGFDETAFAFGSELNLWKQLFEAFYFSIVTFASIGYGDIVPVTTLAKILVIMEIGQSFLLIVFGLSNMNNIRIHQDPVKNH